MKKAIIFDCDNTLWNGVYAEDRIVTINLPLLDSLRFLANKGLIIGICSKNDWSLIKTILDKDLGLLPFLSVVRVNWNDKVSNLKEIQAELNIGMDAIVFVDDSEFERELVKKMLPEIMVIHPDELNEVVLKNFDLTGSILKTQEYQQNKQREQMKAEYTDIDSFLKDLNMVIHIDINNFSQIKRIAELTQKTNQFNLTTIRLSEDQVKSMMNFPCDVITLSVKDKFGDNGLTGVCIIREDIIDVFLLSCRILGRGIEYAFMDKIMEHVRALGFDVLKAFYIPSEKNMQTKDFYRNCGFEILASSDKKISYFVYPNQYKPVSKKHFRYE